MLPCKEQQAAAYKGNRKIAFCPDRQKCPRQICTDLTALVCATAHQNQVWEGHSTSCRDQSHEVELCGSVFFRGQNGDLHGMVLLLTIAISAKRDFTSPTGRWHGASRDREGFTLYRKEVLYYVFHQTGSRRNAAANHHSLLERATFVTALDDPSKVIAEPSGFLIAPRDWERVGDVSNVVFTNGAIADEDGSVYIYYAASDTRLHVASTTIDKLLDFAFNTPADPLRSVDCVKQRCALIDKNLEYLKSIGE